MSQTMIDTQEKPFTAVSMIRVINVPTAERRRTQFKAANAVLFETMNCKFFPAASTNDDCNIQYAIRGTYDEFGRSMTIQELCCYQSHVNVWREFLETDNDQLFVFEDDMIIDPIMLKRLYRTNLHLMGIDLLRLYATVPVRMKLVANSLLSSHLGLYQARGMIFGTQGYCLTRYGAKALLRVAEPIIQPVDWLMMRYWRYGLPNFFIYPFPVLEMQGPSSIDTSGVASPTKIDKLQKLKRTVRDKTLREWADCVTFAEQVKSVGRIFDIAR